MFGNNDGKKPFQTNFTINQNVTSHNQTGGITAHTVNNFEPPQRVLSDQDRRELASMIPKGTKVAVHVPMGDVEAHVYGKETEAYLVSQGHNISPLEFTQYMRAEPVRGKHLEMCEDGSILVVIGSR